MKFENIVLAGIDYNVPEKVLTSFQIEERLHEVYKRLKLPMGGEISRLEFLTGIRERCYWDLGTLPSTIATKAGKNLLNKLSYPKEKIGLLIHSSVCRDCLEPATASFVHKNLELSANTMAFDLSNACLGVLNGMVVAGSMIERRQIESALIVSGENGGPLLFKTIEMLLNDPHLSRKSIKKYIASLSIGSAGVALLLTHRECFYGEFEFAPILCGGSVMMDSSAHHLCRGEGNIHELTMETDSEKLMKVGVELALVNWEKMKENLNWGQNDIDWVINHQVSRVHQETMMKSLSLEDKKTYVTYPYYGNTGSAALPLTLSKLLEQKDSIKKGDKMALLGIGSGLSSIMLGLEW